MAIYATRQLFVISIIILLKPVSCTTPMSSTSIEVKVEGVYTFPVSTPPPHPPGLLMETPASLARDNIIL